MKENLCASLLILLLAGNVSSAGFNLSSILGRGKETTPAATADKAEDAKEEATQESNPLSAILSHAGGAKVAKDMKTLHVVSKLANGQLPDADAIKHLADVAQENGFDVNDEHVDIASAAVEYATTGKGDIKQISKKAGKALTDLASKNGHISDETASDIHEGIAALEERNVGKMARAAGKMFAKSIISKDMLDQGMALKKAAESGNYTEALSSGLNILSSAAGSKYAPPVVKGPAAMFQLAKQYQSGGLAAIDLNTLQKLAPIPLPDGTLGMLAKGAKGIAEGKGVGQIMQEEGANFLAEKAGGVPLFGGMIGGAIKSQMITAAGTPNGATATETEITGTMQSDFSMEEIAVLHKLIAEFAAQHHIQLAPIHESNEKEMKAVSSPQAIARAKKAAAKRKIDEVETEAAETTVEAPIRKRKRTQTAKHVEPEIVETEAEPAPRPIATLATTRKLNAKQRQIQAREIALEAEAETQPEPVVNEINVRKRVQRKKGAPAHASEPEVAESTAVEIAPKITQAKKRKARKTPADSEEGPTVEPVEAPTKRRNQTAPKPPAAIAEIADSSTSAFELLNNATQSTRKRRKGAGAKAIPVVEEDETETEEMPAVKKTKFGKRKRE